MRVYGYATASFYTYLLLMLACTETAQDISKHFHDQRRKTDKTTPSYSTTCQLYSKATGKFVQVIKRTVNANGSDESDAASLVIETDTFGKVRIRNSKSNYYICMNARGEIIGLNEKKGKQMKRCVFKPKRNDGYIQFVSDKYGVRAKTPRYLAFRETGQPKHFSKIFGDRQHATRFVIDQGKSPQKRSVKRNIRRRQLLRQDELLFQEKNKHKRKRLCLIYLRCLNKKWKLNRRKQKITIRCTRRQNYCNCKCTKQ